MIVATVGHNPLPVWLGITNRRRKLGENTRVRLLHTSQTREVADRLAADLQGCVCICVNAVAAAEIAREICADCTEVHITSGLRFMALAAWRAALARSGVSLVYVDEEHGVLIVGDRRQPLHHDSKRLNITKVAALHGYEPVSQSAPQPWTDEQLNALIPAAARGQEELLAEKRRLDIWGGEWMEKTVYRALEKIATPHDCLLGPQDWKRPDKPPFQFDCHIFNGWRLTAISCTEFSDHDAKNKVYEAVHRSRQLGGTAARAIAISTLPQNEVIELKAEVRDQFDVRGRGLLILGKDFFASHSSIDDWAERFREFLTPAQQSPDSNPRSKIDPAKIAKTKRQILATVGTNPLPVLTSLRHHITHSENPSGAAFQIWLLVTKETAPHAERIVQLLKTLHPGVGIEYFQLHDSSPATVKDALSPWHGNPSLALHLIGGKRVVSAWILQALPQAPFCAVSQAGHQIEWSYRAPFKDVRHDPSVSLTLPHLFTLHGASAESLGTAVSADGYAVDGVECQVFESMVGKHVQRVICYILGFQLLMVCDLPAEKNKKLKWAAMKHLSKARRSAGNSAHVLCFIEETKNLTSTKLQWEVDDALGADANRESLWIRPKTADTVLSHILTTDIFEKLGWSPSL